MNCLFTDTCEAYTGSACSVVSGYNNSNVFVRRGKNINNLKDIENKILHAIASIRLRHSSSSSCMNMFEILLCHSSFPLCTNNAVMSLCYNHCRLYQTLQDFCPDAYKEYVKFVGQNSEFMSQMNCSFNAVCMIVPSFVNKGIISIADNYV